MNVLNQASGNGWTIYHADCIEGLKGIPDNSVGWICYSPPFEGMYVFSASERDLANNDHSAGFARHYHFLARELFRVLKPGRLMSVHCMTLPTSKQRDGVIGLKDFPGQLIRIHQRSGMVYHSKVTIWKDPVTSMMRTKALGLLHKQVVKDAAMSRQGIPDELLTFRKPGENIEPIAGKLDEFRGDSGLKLGENATRNSIDIWQRYASPVWMDIDQSRTLQFRSARTNEDERHIAPLQLQVIERGMQLWTNPGDVTLDPFTGIGSCGHVALEMGRKFIGFELKQSYFEMAVKNLRCTEAEVKQGNEGLFSAIESNGVTPDEETGIDLIEEL